VLYVCVYLFVEAKARDDSWDLRLSLDELFTVTSFSSEATTYFLLRA